MGWLMRTAVVLGLVLAAACAKATPTPTATPRPTPVPTATPTPRPTAAPTPAVTATAAPKPTPLSATPTASPSPATPAPTPQPTPVPPAATSTPLPTPAPSPTPGPPAREVKLTLSFAVYGPTAVTVKAGENVKFVLESSDGYHTFTVDELGIDIIAPAIGAVTQEVVIPNKPGTYQFYCRPHKIYGMTGTITVTP